MPVERFRTFEEARRALWLPSGAPGILERMRRLGELARPPAHPHGVFRYRTLEEAKAGKHPGAPPAPAGAGPLRRPPS